MQISPYRFNISPNFCKSKEVKKADIIERKTRAVFPMLSSTYMADNYLIFKKDVQDIDSEAKVLFRLMEGKINAERSNAYILSMLSGNSALVENYKTILERISKIKSGNCEENAKAALAVLFANGYYNSSRAGLEYQVSVVNKETQGVVYSLTRLLDHSFAVTDLNVAKKQDIVIDPWFGFADTKQGAISRFKRVYKDDTEKIQRECSEKFYNLFHRREGFNLDDYEIRTEFVFAPRERLSDFEKEEVGKYAKATYPGVLLDVSG